MIGGPDDLLAYTHHGIGSISTGSPTKTLAEKDQLRQLLGHELTHLQYPDKPEAWIALYAPLPDLHATSVASRRIATPSTTATPSATPSTPATSSPAAPATPGGSGMSMAELDAIVDHEVSRYGDPFLTRPDVRAAVAAVVSRAMCSPRGGSGRSAARSWKSSARATSRSAPPTPANTSCATSGSRSRTVTGAQSTAVELHEYDLLLLRRLGPDPLPRREAQRFEVPPGTRGARRLGRPGHDVADPRRSRCAPTCAAAAAAVSPRGSASAQRSWVVSWAGSPGVLSLAQFRQDYLRVFHVTDDLVDAFTPATHRPSRYQSQFSRADIVAAVLRGLERRRTALDAPEVAPVAAGRAGHFEGGAPPRVTAPNAAITGSRGSAPWQRECSAGLGARGAGRPRV